MAAPVALEVSRRPPPAGPVIVPVAPAILVSATLLLAAPAVFGQDGIRSSLHDHL